MRAPVSRLIADAHWADDLRRIDAEFAEQGGVAGERVAHYRAQERLRPFIGGEHGPERQRGADRHCGDCTARESAQLISGVSVSVCFSPERSCHSISNRVENVSKPRTAVKTFGAGDAVVAAPIALIG